jgi:hypothetical protein
MTEDEMRIRYPRVWASAPAPAPNEPDPIRPAHYHALDVRCPSCNERVAAGAVCEALPYWLGCAAKYLWRHRHKDDAIQDLEKARECIALEIARLKRQANHP